MHRYRSATPSMLSNQFICFLYVRRHPREFSASLCACLGEATVGRDEGGVTVPVLCSYSLSPFFQGTEFHMSFAKKRTLLLLPELLRGVHIIRADGPSGSMLHVEMAGIPLSHISSRPPLPPS